jgi:hypothetical protein
MVGAIGLRLISDLTMENYEAQPLNTAIAFFG